MKLNNPQADCFIPDGHAISEALSRTTHLGIGAHQDDLEFMAFHGIEACFGRADRWFTGVTCTNGAGSPRMGIYGNLTDEEMQHVRRIEQRKAAMVGDYSAMIQLAYPSSIIKDTTNLSLRDDLAQIITQTKPQVIYTHNPADKHETHVAVLVAVVQAIRAIPMDLRPQTLYGCEIWRGLDWLPDTSKVLLDASQHDNIAAALSGVFDSQITGGKRYDLAVQGRRKANATFFESHGVDQASQLTFAMDLTPLIKQDHLDLVEFTTKFIDDFKSDVVKKLKARLGK